MNEDCGYMFLLELAIPYPMDNDSGYMFRLVLAIP